MISICLPSRRRPRHFKRMWQSALDLAYNKDNVEISVRRDVDDRVRYEYPSNHKWMRGKRVENVFSLWNDAQKNATGDLYMYMADDFVFMTKDWDKEVQDVFDSSKDKIMLLSISDGTGGFKHGYSGIGVLHKRWIDTVGYMFPDYFYPNCADKWVNDIAELINRRVISKMVCMPKEEDTHDRVHWEKCKLTMRWRPIYWKDPAAKLREQDAKKLQGVIDEVKHCDTCSR